MAAVAWLGSDGKDHDRPISDELLAREVENESRSAATRAQLDNYLKSEYAPLRLEVCRILSLRRDKASIETLAKIASMNNLNHAVRARIVPSAE